MGNFLPWVAATAAGAKDAFPSQRGSSWGAQLYPGSSGCCRNKLRSPGDYRKAPPHPTELLFFCRLHLCFTHSSCQAGPSLPCVAQHAREHRATLNGRFPAADPPCLPAWW